MADTDMTQSEGTQSGENDSAPQAPPLTPAELALIQAYCGV